MIKQLIILCILTLSLISEAQNSLNNKELSVQGSSKCSFIVSGHFYGGSGKTSGYPAASLLGSLDEINSSNASFLVCLGDMFMDVSNDIPSYKKSLFSKINIPIYNAVGNHDLTDGIYQNNFGETYYSFWIDKNIFVVLDTEKNDGSIEDQQLELLEKASTSGAENILLFSHRPTWAEGDEQLQDVFKGNTKSLVSNNYQDEVLPLLNDSKSNIYWFSGSLGGSAPSSFFYHEKTQNITYIATAIRDLKRDAMLDVSIVDDELIFTPRSLTGQKLLNFSEYNLDFWKTEKAEKFNYRLLPLYVKQIIWNKSFWIGALVTFIFSLLIRKVIRGRRY